MELDYSKIGKRIARRRKELGLKQTEVCERAGSMINICPVSNELLPSPLWKSSCALLWLWTPP